jgi:hypothetical protein
MELVSVATARAAWLFDIAELNPRGKSIFPEILEWLEEEYHFEKAPKSATDLDENKAFAFSRGKFQAGEEIFVDVELKIFTDGLVATSSSSTRDTEAFLESVLKSAAEEFSLAYKPETVRRKLYVSELNVRSSKDLAGINPKLAQVAEKISELLPQNVKLPYEIAGVMISPVQGVSNISISPFRFERKLNTSPDEHKFYSTAPLHTDEHLELLDWFEIQFMT